MLTLMKLRDPEYLLNQVALGIEDYYVGSGEAPGVWHGQWAAQLGLDGLVDADELRALVKGLHPATGVDLLAGRPERAVNAFDATFSAPKSASLLWAFGDAEVSSTVSIAHVEAFAVALDFLESKAAVARQQVGGVRSKVPTAGFAVATFLHRTSRAGDPQIHTHCLIPNLVRRPDGTYVALDAGPLHEWAKAAGSIYQEELRRRLTLRLGVAWGADRNGCREMVGFTDEQLRTFSKRTVEIEEYLGSLALEPTDRAAWMRVKDDASLATRLPKDRSLTPEVLRERWEGEAAEAGLPTGTALAAQVCGREVPGRVVIRAEVFARLLDPEEGLCARSARFGEAHVVEAVAALGAGRLDVEQVEELAAAFLASDHVVRLVGREPEDGRRRPPQWSTTVHLALERQVLSDLNALAATAVGGIDPAVVERALDHEALGFGDDQAAAVWELCAPGPALRALVAPAGFGKTTAVHAAATASLAAGRHVLGLATTNQAVGELRAVGLPAMTLARFALELQHSGGLEPDTTLILDEVSQVATADVAVVLGAPKNVRGVQLWCLGTPPRPRRYGPGDWPPRWSAWAKRARSRPRSSPSTAASSIPPSGRP